MSSHDNRTITKAFERGFRASSDAITISRLDDGVIIEANESFCALVEIPRHEVIGKTATELGIYEDPTSRARMLQRVLHRGGISDHEVIVRTRGGERVHASLSADLISQDGEVQLYTIGRDITDRREREEALLARLHHPSRRAVAPTCCTADERQDLQEWDAELDPGAERVVDLTESGTDDQPAATG